MVVVEDHEDRDLPKIMGQDAGDDLWVCRPMLPEAVLEAATTEEGEEGREILEQDRPGRALVDLEPIDVGPRTLPDEPTRDERTLPDPCDAGDDQEGRRRDGPRVELHEFLRAAEHAAEPPQGVAPQQRRDGSGTDAVEPCEVEPAATNEGDSGCHVDVRRDNR